jgi:hypothetical protein
MIEHSLFRVVRTDRSEAILTWAETIEVLESGEWIGIQCMPYSQATGVGSEESQWSVGDVVG